ncbi:hypothetical protein K7432_004206 [Basidiobolus ranarum]|uniref:FAR1 domain-containing protein n=1 Tax=Basidiobolus ranarum TaxID=34480 RepID=A0ABR2WYM9_9FUNG
MDFREIFAMQFSTAQEAFEWCQQLAKKCGFGVRRRTSKSSTIYIVCSREGRPESKKNAVRKRNRTSERCNCDWRVVLYLTDKKLWEFRAGKCMAHNHGLSYEIRSTSRKRTKSQDVIYHSNERTSTYHSMSPPPFGSPAAHQTPLISPTCKLSKPQLVPLTDLTHTYQNSSPYNFPPVTNSIHFDFTYSHPFGTLRTPTSSHFSLGAQKPCPFEENLTKLPPIATPPLECVNPGFESVDSDTSEEEGTSQKASNRPPHQHAKRSLSLDFILNKQ